MPLHVSTSSAVFAPLQLLVNSVIMALIKWLTVEVSQTVPVYVLNVASSLKLSICSETLEPHIFNNIYPNKQEPLALPASAYPPRQLNWTNKQYAQSSERANKCSFIGQRRTLDTHTQHQQEDQLNVIGIRLNNKRMYFNSTAGIPFRVVVSWTSCPGGGWILF